jgi:hypothetical protein
MRPSETLKSLLILLTGIVPIHVARAAWDIVPLVDTRVVGNDNVRLQADDSGEEIPSASSAEIDARVRFSSVGERGNLHAEPRIRASHYSDQANKDLGSDDTFLRTAGEYAWERVTAGFRTDYDKQSILNAELVAAAPDDPNVDDPTAVDTGRLVLLDQYRKRLLVSPYTNILIAERSRLALGIDWLDVAYSHPDLTDRASFTDKEAYAGIIRQVDELNAVSARFYVSKYEADANQNTTNTAGIVGDFTRPLTQGWTMDLTYGVARSDYVFTNQQGQVVDNADTNVIYDARFRRRTERTILNISLDRRVTPNSDSFVALRHELRVYLDRALSERLTTRVGIRVFQTATVDDADQRNNDRDYRRLEFSMDWAMTERMFLSGGYNYTLQDFKNDNRGSGNSNSIFIGFNFRGRSKQL